MKIRDIHDLIGSRVVAGEGEDKDTGRVIDVLSDNMVEVAWDSGVRTPAPIDILRPEEEA